MTTPTALLIGADVVRLYRTLRAAGAAFPRLRLRLGEDARGMWRMGFRLVENAAAQIEPDVKLMHKTYVRASFAVRAPSLIWLNDFEKRRIMRQLDQHFHDYTHYPIQVSLAWLPHEQGLMLQVDFWDTVPGRWYPSRSFCDFWRVFRSAIAEIRRLDAQAQQRTAAGAVPEQR